MESTRLKVVLVQLVQLNKPITLIDVSGPTSVTGAWTGVCGRYGTR